MINIEKVRVINLDFLFVEFSALTKTYQNISRKL